MSVKSQGKSKGESQPASEARIAAIGLQEGRTEIETHLDAIERLLKALPVSTPDELIDRIVQLRAHVHRAFAGHVR